jgi:hypothetical protein
MSQLVLKVQQGEKLNIPFEIKSNGLAVDLTSATITFQVKKAPYITNQPMFSKTITTSTDPDVDGQITFPLQGKFEVHLTEADTSYVPQDYYLIIFLDVNSNKNDISSIAGGNAIYKVCTQ